MIKWEIARKEIITAKPPCVRQRIFYRNQFFQGWSIVSVKHAELHADGRGEWAWTDYTVVTSSGAEHSFSRLIDAKKYVQEHYGEEK